MILKIPAWKVDSILKELEGIYGLSTLRSAVLVTITVTMRHLSSLLLFFPYFITYEAENQGDWGL